MNRKWSFAQEHKTEKTYREFLEAFNSGENYEMAIKESRNEITDLLKEDIIVPDFYRDVAEL